MQNWYKYESLNFVSKNFSLVVTPGWELSVHCFATGLLLAHCQVFTSPFLLLFTLSSPKSQVLFSLALLSLKSNISLFGYACCLKPSHCLQQSQVLQLYLLLQDDSKMWWSPTDRTDVNQKFSAQVTPFQGNQQTKFNTALQAWACVPKAPPPALGQLPSSLSPRKGAELSNSHRVEEKDIKIVFPNFCDLFNSRQAISFGNVSVSMSKPA